MNPDYDKTVPTNAADATEEVNQQQAQDQQEQGVAQPEGHKLASVPAGSATGREHVEDATITGASVQSQEDVRVPSQPLNPPVTSGQPVTEPGRPGPDQNAGEPDPNPAPPPTEEPSV